MIENAASWWIIYWLQINDGMLYDNLTKFVWNYAANHLFRHLPSSSAIVMSNRPEANFVRHFKRGHFGFNVNI